MGTNNDTTSWYIHNFFPNCCFKLPIRYQPSALDLSKGQ